MNRHSLAIRTWKFALLALALAFNGACGSDDDGGDDDMEQTDTTPDGGGGAGKGGDVDSTACTDDSKVLLESSVGRLINYLVVDDDFLYLSQGSSEDDDNGIFRMPKAGGDLTKIGEMDTLLNGGPIYVDGDDLYYGDSQLNRIKKDGSGEVEMLFEAEGGISQITGDADAIYFVHGNFCCDSLGTDVTQHLRRLDKKTGEVTELVAADDLDSVVSDGENVFWLGSIEKQEEIGALSESAHSLMRTPAKGGESTVVFEAPADLSGLNPSSGFGEAMVLNDTEVIFGSINLHDSTVGIYRIAKTANKGTPTEISDTYSLNSPFLIGSSIYSSDALAIERIAIADGSVDDIACGATHTPTLVMTHDDENIYYARGTEYGGDAEKLGQELRVTAIDSSAR